MAEDASAARALKWKARNYTEDLPDDIGPFRELLENYSNIPPEMVNEHLHSIVGIPYPFIQLKDRKLTLFAARQRLGHSSLPVYRALVIHQYKRARPSLISGHHQAT